MGTLLCGSMAYLGVHELAALGLRSLGNNVKVSDRAAIYDPERISIGDNARIDDFTVLAGGITIGRNVHVTVFCNLAGGRAGITIADFATLAYGCHVVAQTDDYSGRTMTNSTVPARFKHETSAPVSIGRHVILGTGTVVLPGVNLGDGVSAGARTLFLRSAEPWGVYVGSPARRIKERSRDLLALEREFLDGEPDDAGGDPVR